MNPAEKKFDGLKNLFKRFGFLMQAKLNNMKKYYFCGKPITIRNDHAYRDGQCIGPVFDTEYGWKYLAGPKDKGKIDEVEE